MSETDPVAHVDPLEILAQWEGPAIHEPGVLFDEKHAEYLANQAVASRFLERVLDPASFGVPGDAAELAGWIAVTVLSGVIGNSAYEALKSKVLGVLSGRRRRFGQAKIDEIKQELFKQMQKYRTNRKITDEELRQRIDLFFAEIQV